MPDSSFEVALAVTEDEIRLIEEGIRQKGESVQAEAVEYLRSERTVYRSFNYQGGRYEQNQLLQNQAYQLVTRALREEYQRSLGFFLRADRHYPNRGFQQNAIFQYAATRQKAHSWNMAFNLSDAQYADIYDFIIQQRYHYFTELGSYHHDLNAGKAVGKAPSDPLLPYNDLLGQLFPGYSFADQGGEIPSDLLIDVPPGLRLSFNDLSSGEKEVFFLLSFFLRHDVRNAIIMIDEPELHLHPELARKLMSLMKSIRPGNQIWAATHNAEILDEAGRDRVTYISRDELTRQAVVTRAADESEELRLLRDMFGYSGYIGVARTMVFLEGEELSTDRKLMSALLPGSSSSLVKFVPAGGVDSHTRLNAAILKLIEANFGYIRFYLVRDRDYLTDEMVTKYARHSSGRIHVLDRYHVENYLLDNRLIRQVVNDLWEKDLYLDVVERELKRAATEISSEVVAGMFAYRMNAAVRPQDFSLGSLLKNQPFVEGESFDVVNERDGIIRSAATKKVASVKLDLDSSLDSDSTRALLDRCISIVQEALRGDDWRRIFPGRRILQRFSSNAQLGDASVFQNALIKELGRRQDWIPLELRQMLTAIVEDQAFT
jgi:hypothetical protein